jgi:predicted lipoprotein with Yx(FWY)xxD motif
MGEVEDNPGMRRLYALAFVAVLLLVGGCGDDSSDAGSTEPRPAAEAPAVQPASTPKKPKPKPTGTKIALKGSQFGKILYDSPRGQAIYLFDRETSRKPRCYGACADAWPPVYAKGTPRAGKGIDPGLLGTTKRSDGRRQVTYGGHALYFYAHEGPGQVLCQDVEEFGGTWLVVRANGDPVPGSS